MTAQATTRTAWARVSPEAYQAMLALEATGGALDPALRELIRMRASGLNGCAYCLDLHAHEAAAQGESLQRLVTVAAARPAATTPPVEARPLVEAFLAAARGGDLGRLQTLLREDVVVTTDGNGAARAGRHPIHGARKAARLFAAVFERFYAGAEIIPGSYNHAPAFLIRTPAREVVYVLDCDAEGRIAEVYVVLNPDKLRHLGLRPHADGEGPGPGGG